MTKYLPYTLLAHLTWEGRARQAALGGGGGGQHEATKARVQLVVHADSHLLLSRLVRFGRTLPSPICEVWPVPTRTPATATYTSLWCAGEESPQLRQALRIAVLPSPVSASTVCLPPIHYGRLWPSGSAQIVLPQVHRT